MKRSLSLTIAISSGLLLLQAVNSPACQTGSASITNLPPIPGAGFQVFDMNATGQLTGFYFVFGVQSGHAFLYSSNQLSDLGTLGGGTSEGHWINSSGQIVGKASLTGNAQSHAFLSNNGGGVLDLGTLGGPNSTATAINDQGVIIGDSDLPGSVGSSAFIYANGAMTGLGNLGSNYSSAFALNNNGFVVGESGIASGDVHAFTYANGTLSDLGTLGGTYSSAFAVNDAGEVVGESSVASSDVHGFVFQGGVMTDVGTFGGTYSSAYQVNAGGQAIGVATTAGDQQTHGFVYAAGVLTDLGTLGGTDCSAIAINNRGQVVGESLTASGATHAFLWQHGKLSDLNDLLPANSGWELVTALYINDAGRVVGVGNLGGMSQWFILDLPAGNTAPIAVAGPDQTVDCQAQVTLDGSGSSDPDNDPITFEWSWGGTVLGTNVVLTVSLPLGTNVVTLQVTDTCGASTQTNVTVVVADTTPPAGSCPASVTASADNSCQAAVPDFASQVVATDNCTPTLALSITQNPTAGTLVGLGPHPVTVTVTDGSGNSSTCSVLFTVADTTAPTIISTPAAFTLSAGPDGQAQVPNILANVSASDSCTPVNQLVKTQSPAAGSQAGLGSHSILVTVSDASGNASTASTTFTVVDISPPTIQSGPGAIKLSADASCQAVVPNVLTGVVVTDNCTSVNQIGLVQSPAAGTVLPRGVYSIVVTATDGSGNNATFNVPLEIDDTTAPTILSSPAQVTVSADGNCQGLVPNVLTNILVADNCTPANQLVMTQDPAAGSTLPDGLYTINVSVTDAAGNTSTAKIPLSVVDTTPPVFKSLSVSPNVLSPPNHQLVHVTVSACVVDNCDAAPVTKIVSITCSDPTAPGDMQITGDLTATLAANKADSGNRVYTITVQSTDASGNSATGTVTVVVPRNNGGTLSLNLRRAGITLPMMGTLGSGWYSSGKDDDSDGDDHDRGHH